MPANTTLTNGAGTFPVTLKTAGSQTVTATDTVTGSITGVTGAITVSAAAASHLGVALTSSATITAGGTVNFTVTALDPYGNTATTYTGLVKFTSTDSAAALPTTTTLANGVGGFSATLKTSGTGSFQFTAQIKDTVTNLTSSAQTYTIQVNSAGATLNGHISLDSACGSSSTLPPISVSINTTPVQTVQPDINGNFSFTPVPNGSYTITPSLFNPPTGAASLFSPATMTGVTVNNADINNLNFQVQVAYTVSGSVAYSGSHTGRIYVSLTGGCGGNGGVGSSLAAAGSFTLHGVQPGNYTLVSWMDPTDLGLGEGYPNISDPTGSVSVTVTTGNATGANVTLANNDPGSAPSSGPKINQVFGTHNGVLLAYKPLTDSNGNELATSYDVAWSTSAALSSGSLASVAGTITFKALGDGTDIWILNNSVTGSSSFSDGQTYYFEARANNSAGHSAWKLYGSSSPTGVVAGAASAGNTITGNVTIPAGVTVASNAQLYVGFFSDTAGVVATQISSPAVGSNNPFTIHVPSGTWQFFGILDQNNDGAVDAGDITNVNSKSGGPPTVVLSASGTQNLTLPGGNSQNSVATIYSQQTFWNGSAAQTSIGYSLDFQIREGAKLPVAVTLTSGPNVIAPVDLSNYCQGCGNMRFEYAPNLFTDSTQAPFVPAVGDTYKFTVTYSDGTQDTNVTAAVTGWNAGSTVVGASNAPSNLSPTGASSAGTTPTFTWTDPASSQGSNFFYNFSISQASNCSGSCDIWDIPGQNSNSNGFSSSITSLTWGTDPTNGGSSPSSSLTVGTQYNWTIQVDDPESNRASTQTWYQP